MKVIIAGGREIFDVKLVLQAVRESGWADKITEIVNGACPSGVDLIAKNIFQELYPIKYFEAEWDKYGLSAGPRRNRQMAEYADALILIWNGKSSGSKSMLQEMTAAMKPIFNKVVK
jgi:hypothetical protein